MRSFTRLAIGLVAVLLALGGCAANNDDATSGGTRLAFGLHEQADGTVVALGTLEWIELEGGLYALTGAPDDGGTIAVIANPDDFEAELSALVGADVEVHGTLVEGPSIRMAGPELEIDSIREITDASDPGGPAY